jgi:2-methylcitrate dehydratase PrpD
MAKTHSLQGPGAVENLADWALAVRADAIPDATLQQAKLLLLDTIGCGYAALGEAAARAVIATMAETGGAPQCTVIGSKTKTSAPAAVLLNGALVRILDLNDYVNTKSGQIGGRGDNIPVALAAGNLWRLGRSAGRDRRRLRDLRPLQGGHAGWERWDGIMVSGFAAQRWLHA